MYINGNIWRIRLYCPRHCDVAVIALIASSSTTSNVGPVVLATLEGRSNLFIETLYRCCCYAKQRHIWFKSGVIMQSGGRENREGERLASVGGTRGAEGITEGRYGGRRNIFSSNLSIFYVINLTFSLSSLAFSLFSLYIYIALFK